MLYTHKNSIHNYLTAHVTTYSIPPKRIHRHSKIIHIFSSYVNEQIRQPASPPTPTARLFLRLPSVPPTPIPWTICHPQILSNPHPRRPSERAGKKKRRCAVKETSWRLRARVRSPDSSAVSSSITVLNTSAGPFRSISGASVGSELSFSHLGRQLWCSWWRAGAAFR